MNYEDIDRLLQIHRKAYTAFLELKALAKENSVLSGYFETGRFEEPEFCKRWVFGNLGQLPVDAKPTEDEVDEFGNLLASFLKTSFHLEVHPGANVQVKFETGLRPPRRKTYKTRRTRRIEDKRDELKLAALLNLAEEADLEVLNTEVAEILESGTLSGEITLWTYVCELKRRTQFVSQGEPVHRLWLELDKRVRSKLNVDMVLKAKDELLDLLKNAKTNK